MNQDDQDDHDDDDDDVRLCPAYANGSFQQGFECCSFVQEVQEEEEEDEEEEEPMHKEEVGALLS